jgi:hypothetical protein
MYKVEIEKQLTKGTKKDLQTQVSPLNLVTRIMQIR